MAVIKNGVSISKLRQQDVSELFYASWAIAKKHYWKSLLFALATTIVPLGIATYSQLAQFSFYGLKPLSSVLVAVYGVAATFGTVHVLKKWLAGQEAYLDTFLSFFSGTTPHGKYVGLIAVLTAHSLTTNIMINPMGGAAPPPLTITGGFAIVVAVLGLFSSLIVPLIAFKNLNLAQAFETALAVIVENAFPLLLIYIGIFGIAVVSLALCGLPYLFFAIPLLYPVHYFFYCASCEGLVVDRYNYQPRPEKPSPQAPPQN